MKMDPRDQEPELMRTRVEQRVPEQETWAPQSEDSVLSASATCSTQLCLASQSLGASGAASVKWPLKPTSGVTMASNVSTKTAENVLQAESCIHGPWKPDKIKEPVPWAKTGRSGVG